MSRFSSSTQLSETGYLGVAADEAAFATQAVYNDVAGAAPTLTAAQMVNGEVNLTTQSTAQTVTTDTAAAMTALIPNLQVGSYFDLVIKNSYTAGALATLAAGAGVTITGVASIPSGSAVEFLGVVTNATTPAVTLYAKARPVLPDSQYSTAALQSTSMTAAQFAGAKVVHFENTGTTPGNLATPTAAQIIAAIPNAIVGQSYTLFIRNSSSGANTATITAGDGNVTLTGTMTIAQNVTRMFNVKVASGTTVTVTSMGIFAAGA